MPRYRMVVHGRVQGVGFRWTCLQNAKNGLTGWVRNRRRRRIAQAG
ncbi:MAG: acylphosphatase [Anaeromassilibacillus sp.]